MAPRAVTEQNEARSHLILTMEKLNLKLRSHEQQCVGLFERINQLKSAGLGDDYPEVAKRKKRLERIQRELIPRVYQELNTIRRVLRQGE